jgi:hypothetical protein
MSVVTEQDKCFLVCLAILLFGTGILIGAWGQDVFEEGQAIKHGAGRYNPETGHFEWLDDVDAAK